MGYKAKLKRIGRDRKHQTKKLREIIGTDLLTAKEKMIKNEISGLYAMTDEQAYCKLAKDEPSLHINEFARRLKEIDNNFTVVPCELITPPHIIQGHSIYFHVPAFGGFIKVCNVGKNMDYNIPAESVGMIRKIEGTEYNGDLDEVPLLYRGWVAALECCKTAYLKWEDEGISPAMIMTAEEVLHIREKFNLIGFQGKLDSLKTEHEKALINDEVILLDAEAKVIEEDREIEIQDISLEDFNKVEETNSAL